MQRDKVENGSRDIKQTEAVEQALDEIIHTALDFAQDNSSITQQLSNETIFNRPLQRGEIVSILRNWTSGDLGSMALCIGVIVAYLVSAENQSKLLDQLRQSSDKELELFIDEVLRLDNPFISNRRRTTCAVTIGEHEIPDGEQIVLSWTSANRDETVFGEIGRAHV